MEKRLLSLQEAADYCGIPKRNFKKNMPVQTIRLGPHELWDIRSIDSYIDGLQGVSHSGSIDWSEAIERFRQPPQWKMKDRK